MPPKKIDVRADTVAPQSFVVARKGHRWSEPGRCSIAGPEQRPLRKPAVPHVGTHPSLIW